MGLVVSVTVNDVTAHPTTDNFLVRSFDDAGRPSGDLSCLALRQLPDGGGPKPPWILLDSPTGSLERSYAALLASKAAIVQKNRQRVVEHAGHCEFVFLIGPAAKQGALLFGENRPDVARLPVGSWLVDTQHGPMGNERLSGMLAGIANGGATSMVRVGGYAYRARHPAVAGHGRRWRAGALHQHRGRGARGGQLLSLPDSRHAVGGTFRSAA